MSSHSFDSIQFKDEMRRDWSAAAAGWNKWWQLIEREAQPVSDRLVDLAEIRAGSRVLDIATGIGEPAVTAARRVGATGRVVAIDMSPEMVALGRTRAAQLGLSNIEFREMDAETLELPESSFDAVLCRWGLMFFPNVCAALEGIRELLTPGGRLAVAVWSMPPQVPMISLAADVVREVLGVDPPSPEVPGPFRLADIRILSQALAGAGFTDIHSDKMMVLSEFPSPEIYAQSRKDISVSLGSLLASYPPERQTRAWQAVVEAVRRRYTGQDGIVRMHNETVCVVARR